MSENTPSTPEPRRPQDEPVQPGEQPTYEQASEQPGLGQPTSEQATPEQAAPEQPAFEQPAVEQPAVEQPAYEEPGDQQPPSVQTADQPVYQQGYEQGSQPQYGPGAQQGSGQQGYEQPHQQSYQQGYGPGAANQLSPNDERTWSIAAHLSPFLASFVGLPFLGPLVIYLVFRDRGPFVRHHAAQALNFQIIVAIGLLISIPLMFVVIGIFTAIAIGIAAIILQIVAAIEANNGKWYRYPLTPDWVK
jgi:uncharacterized Tic20 family protein